MSQAPNKVHALDAVYATYANTLPSMSPSLKEWQKLLEFRMQILQLEAPRYAAHYSYVVIEHCGAASELSASIPPEQAEPRSLAIALPNVIGSQSSARPI